MEQVGNTLVLRSVVQVTIGDLSLILSMLGPNAMGAGREFHEQSERDWSANSPGVLMQTQNRGSNRYFWCASAMFKPASLQASAPEPA